jgi:oxygen-independent coproporphyrinogen-3 oxidase
MVFSLLPEPHYIPRPSGKLDLLRKYSGPVPRYTSYPPANHFSDDLAVVRPASLIARDNLPGAGPLSLYVHLPFCQQRCWFCGCTNLITTRQSAADDYLDDLEREIALTAPFLDPARPVTQFHLGGGTPTFLSPAQLRRLGRLFRGAFSFASDAEIAVEIDPRHLDAAQVEALREFGAHRASLGVQDTDPAVQVAIHRVQPPALNERAVTLLRTAGFTSINIDLIHGLPKQTVSTFARTIDDVLGLGPDRLSATRTSPDSNPRNASSTGRACCLRRTKNSACNSSPRTACFPPATSRSAWITTRAHPTNSPPPPAPADSTAISRATAPAPAPPFTASASPPSRPRPTATARTTKASRPTARGWRLTDEDRRRRTIIMRIMCEHRLEFAALSRELGLDFPRVYAAELASLAALEADGMVTRTDSGIEITDTGLPFVRVAASRFDAYLGRGPGCHSRAV